MALSLVSVNIERDKHLERVVPFVEERNPDVLCLQEVSESHLPLFTKLGYTPLFAPMLLWARDGTDTPQGLGIFSKTPFVDTNVEQYAGQPGPIMRFDETTTHTKQATEKYLLATADIAHEDAIYRICTTHFTWTPDGEADDYQRADIAKLLALLSKQGEFALCGDFNAPRGGEIFAQLAERYTDNIPTHYEGSLDLTLHRAGQKDGERLKKLMVDGLFTTAGYQTENTELVFGVSDHAAIVSTITKA